MFLLRCQLLGLGECCSWEVTVAYDLGDADVMRFKAGRTVGRGLLLVGCAAVQVERAAVCLACRDARRGEVRHRALMPDDIVIRVGKTSNSRRRSLAALAWSKL